MAVENRGRLDLAAAHAADTGASVHNAGQGSMRDADRKEMLQSKLSSAEAAVVLLVDVMQLCMDVACRTPDPAPHHPAVSALLPPCSAA